MPHAPTRIGPLYYELHGQGPPVLLVMGLGMHGRAWEHQVAGLRDRFRLCTFDNRGVGRSPTPPGPWHMRDMARDALELLDHLGWDDAHVCGTSLGGMIALTMALEARERVRSLALAVTHAGGPLAWIPPWRGLLRGLAMRWTRDADRRLHLMHRLRWSEAYARRVEARGGPWPHEFHAARIPVGVKRQGRAVFRYDVRRRLHELEGVPTLVIRARDDLVIRPRHSLELARRIPGARRVDLDAGHGVVMEAADRVNALLAEHWEAAERRRGQVA